MAYRKRTTVKRRATARTKSGYGGRRSAGGARRSTRRTARAVPRARRQSAPRAIRIEIVQTPNVGVAASALESALAQHKKEIAPKRAKF